LGFTSVLLIAIALAVDAFTVAVASGLILRQVHFRHVFRIGFHFGLLQFLMPLLGWLAGTTVVALVRDFDHWVAFLLLAGIGVKMIMDGGKPEQEKQTYDPTRGWRLVLLSVATSIDAFAVGLSFALLEIPIFYPALVIGAIALLLSSLGISFGNRLGDLFRQRAEIVGGVVLMGIGVRILIEHKAFVLFERLF